MSKTTCTKAMSSIIQYANKDYPKLYYIHIKLDPNTTSMLYIDNTRYKNTHEIENCPSKLDWDSRALSRSRLKYPILKRQNIYCPL